MRISSRSFLLWPVFAAMSAHAQEAFDRLTFHAVPKPLPEGAKTADWPRLLGPDDDATSPETRLLRDWPQDGPAKVWEVVRGEGYTSPAISGDFCVIFHALDGQETVECLHRETGRRFWKHQYPIVYQDRYGFSNGPRASPVIAGDHVVTLGVTSVLTCLNLKTGAKIWQHDLRAQYQVPQDFFGAGSSPLILDGKVIVNVGGKAETVDESASLSERKRILATKGVSVAAFDLNSGDVVWKVEDDWGASYASPVPAMLHGRKKVLVYAGGESDPPTGGLMCMDAADGTLHDRFFWRADDYISAQGSSPVVIPGKNRAFISTCYPKGRPLGGVMVEFDENFKAREVWRSAKLGIHWMNPVYHDGHLYAIDGERENNSRLVCVNADTGAEVWEEDLKWDDEALGRRMNRPAMKMGILRASLLRVDGAFLCLGEVGTLLWLDLSPAGCHVRSRAQLFYAQQSWSLPAISHGLLYTAQQSRDMDERPPRVLCYDLRGK
jgi:outer membrane protein assembly factor BamB